MAPRTISLLSWSRCSRKNLSIFNFPLEQTDRTYISCVFSWNAHKLNGLIGESGGSGLDISGWLPEEVEHIMPDYSLYDMDFSMGYATRGCPRHCPWCIVPYKEGDIKAWAEVREFYNPAFSRMLLLDNNTLAAPNAKETLEDLAGLPVEVDINQGLDIRLLTDEFIYLLKQIRTKVLRFAFDSMGVERFVKLGIEKLLKAGFNKRHLSFYVLVGFPSYNAYVLILW